jgi:Ca-activated chloride channel family protein
MRYATGLALLTFALVGSAVVEPTRSEAAMVASTRVVVSGVVRDAQRKPIEGAVVTLDCASEAEPRETITNAEGIYAFRPETDPSGICTVQVLAGKADVTKRFRLTAGGRMRANFNVDPTGEIVRTITVKSPPVEQTTSVGRTVSMEEFRNIPVGASTGRDFTQVVESSATASHDAAGISLSGTTADSQAGFRGASEPFNREGYAHLEDNPFVEPLDRPLSTFAADVDTASYANVRRFITQGQLPPPDAVRVEELLNYFDYDYVVPRGDKPVSVNWEISTCPWDEQHLLARVGLQTKPIAAKRVPPRNLVFLLDVSGSMDSPDKLPLLQRAMGLLVDNLRPQDHVSIVVYAGAAGVVLPPTSGRHLSTIRDAIADLEPGGSTNGAGGIREAYRLARKSFVRRGINRVILATDGDFNVGTTSDGALVRLIERERKSGVFLSVLGFGQGNLQDAKMEQLADKGNGNYAYIDDLAEARKVLVEQAGATLVTVAKDVKLQVEFNPAKVAGYRLVGYENRRLADRDFDDDSKDAGDMGAGHSVTALYELVPTTPRATGKSSKGRALRYQRPHALDPAAPDEWMTVAVRYKAPDSETSERFEVPMTGRPHGVGAASDDLRFAAAVAMYGMVLRDSDHRGRASLAMAQELAEGATGSDDKGYRAEFVQLVAATTRLERRSRRDR